MTADAGIFMGWNRPVAGREAHAIELLSMTRNFFDNQKKNGNIVSYDTVILTAHAGDLNGFILVQGDARKLTTLVDSDEFMDLVVKCNYTLQGFGVVKSYVNTGVDRVMNLYKKNI